MNIRFADSVLQVFKTVYLTKLVLRDFEFSYYSDIHNNSTIH